MNLTQIKLVIKKCVEPAVEGSIFSVAPSLNTAVQHI